MSFFIFVFFVFYADAPVHALAWPLPLLWVLCALTRFLSGQVEERLLAMNEVLLSGLSALPPAAREVVVAHVADCDNWARLIKPKASPVPSSSAAVPPAPTSSSSSSSSSSSNSSSTVPPAPSSSSVPLPSTISSNSFGGGSGAAAALVVSSPAAGALAVARGAAKPQTAVGAAVRQKFVVPVPGVNGAKPHALAGKTLVLTGVFPELGGGCGLNLGKARLTALVEQFGGRVRPPSSLRPTRSPRVARAAC